MKNELIEIVSKFQGKKILVIGDVMLDEYIWGKVSRISPEAPVPVVEVQRTSYVPGGAANVAVNIASLGGKVFLAGVIGSDEAGGRLKEFFFKNGTNIDGLVLNKEQPTTVKTRVIAHNQQVVRIDHELIKPIADQIERKLLSYSLNIIDGMDAILVSDYDKGVTNPKLLKHIISRAKDLGKPIVVDPKGTDFSKYKGVTMVTPNQIEAGLVLNEKITTESSLIHVGKGLLINMACEAVLITRGEAGMSLFEVNEKITHLPACARQVYDVTGAGDTVAGTLTLALTTGADLVNCAAVANYAAGIVVEKVGTAIVTSDELKRFLKNRRLTERTYNVQG